MKYRLDFVTNSSSSSFIATLRVKSLSSDKFIESQLLWDNSDDASFKFDPYVGYEVDEDTNDSCACSDDECDNEEFGEDFFELFSLSYYFSNRSLSGVVTAKTLTQLLKVIKKAFDINPKSSDFVESEKAKAYENAFKSLIKDKNDIERIELVFDFFRPCDECAPSWEDQIGCFVDSKTAKSIVEIAYEDDAVSSVYGFLKESDSMLNFPDEDVHKLSELFVKVCNGPDDYTVKQIYDSNGLHIEISI